MKRKFSILIVSMVIIGLALSLVGTVLISQAAPSERPGKPDKQKPVFATSIELVKKVSVRMPGGPLIVPPGQDKKKKKEGAATGMLGDPVSGNRYAIVVGISDYPGEENDLNYCDDDAIEMRNALVDVDIYGFDSENVTLLMDIDATRYDILSAIESIPLDADEVVFFFSGHGMRGIAEDGDRERVDEAIITHDGTDIVPIWDGELKAAFSEFATSRIIFIFDTCLAGGMKKDLEVPGRVIAMATTERGTAIESADLENGEFSYYFVDKGILQGEANTHDYDKDEILGESNQVTVEEAFDYAKANCSHDRPTIGDYFDDDLLL